MCMVLLIQLMNTFVKNTLWTYFIIHCTKNTIKTLEIRLIHILYHFMLRWILTFHKERLHTRAQVLGQKEQTWKSFQHWGGIWKRYYILMNLMKHPTSGFMCQIMKAILMAIFHLTCLSWGALLNSLRLVPVSETPFRKTSLWSSLKLMTSLLNKPIWIGLGIGYLVDHWFCKILFAVLCWFDGNGQIGWVDDC